jgi:hypothetical protein
VTGYSKRYNTAYPSTAGIGSGNYMLYGIAPVLTVAADAKSREYGEANPALTYAASGFIDGDAAGNTLAGSLSTAAAESSPVGQYAIDQGTLVELLGYMIDFTGENLTITPAPLSVTADDKSKEYGDSNPALTASYSGFKGSDTAAVVGGLTLSTAATTDSTVGDYTITAADGTATNYTLSFIDGLLTITAAPEPTQRSDIGEEEPLRAAITTVQSPTSNSYYPGGDLIRIGGRDRSGSPRLNVGRDNENRSGGLAFVEVPAGNPDVVALANQEDSGFLRVFLVNGGINLPAQAGN